jgi:hypothetical protein
MFYTLRTNEPGFFIHSNHGKIKEWQEAGHGVFPKAEFIKTLYKFDENTHGNEPTNHGNELPEKPVFGTTGDFQHGPGIIKGNICFPGRRSGFLKQFGQTKGR